MYKKGEVALSKESKLKEKFRIIVTPFFIVLLVLILWFFLSREFPSAIEVPDPAIPENVTGVPDTTPQPQVGGSGLATGNPGNGNSGGGGGGGGGGGNPPNPAVCGNNVTESGEQCDDGNTNSTDGCSSTCNLELIGATCGDSIVNGTEICDVGVNTTDLFDDVFNLSLVTDCTSFPGYYNGNLSCDLSCLGYDLTTCTTSCGDSITSGAEFCDGNVTGCEINGYAGNRTCLSDCSAYNSTCVLYESCGDSAIQALANETCDMLNLGGIINCSDLAGENFDSGNLSCNSVGSQFQCTYNTTGCGTCNNGAIDGTEECEIGDIYPCETDGGYDGFFSCTSTCSGFDTNCASEEYCGDGKKNGNEFCDDNNTANGDGCSQACQIENGWQCIGVEPSICTVLCGNDIITSPEACDGDTVSCSSLGYDGNKTCLSDCSDYGQCILYESCGDTIIQTSAGEQCEGTDLGGLINCIDLIWDNYDSGTISCYSSGESLECRYNTTGCGLCGNSVIDGTETCDDGGTTNGNGCSSSCQEELGWDCSGEPSSCIEVCGDGTQTISEECDDNNLDSGDGCSSSCLIEFCGDGTIQLGLGEQCDDNNTGPGDGCSQTCQEELGWSCVGAPSACTEDCGDSIIVGSEECDTGNLGFNTCNTEGFDDGFLTCDSSCNIDNSTCFNYICGDNDVNQLSEVCDGLDLNGRNCTFYGYDNPGNLLCLGSCADYNSSQCGDICGNNIQGPTETCELGNTTSCFEGGYAGNRTCLSDCSAFNSTCVLYQYCGDNQIQAGAGEQCDNGLSNSDTIPNACRTDCTPAACGDNVIDAGETCDDGNQGSGDGCSATCQSEGVTQTCGNSIVEGTEQCDPVGFIQNCNAPGDYEGNRTCQAGCVNGACVPYEFCGDGVVNGNEACDSNIAVNCHVLNPNYISNGESAYCSTPSNPRFGVLNCRFDTSQCVTGGSIGGTGGIKDGLEHDNLLDQIAVKQLGQWEILPSPPLPEFNYNSGIIKALEDISKFINSHLS